MSSAYKAAEALAELSGLAARLRVSTNHVAIAKTLAAMLAPFSLRTSNAQSVGRGRGVVRMARLTSVTPWPSCSSQEGFAQTR